MIKVVTISTSVKGGAGIAAYRLHNLLNSSKEVESHFITLKSEKENDNISNCKRVYPNFYQRVMHKLQGIKPEYYAMRFSQKILSKYPDNYEIATSPITYFKPELHPKVLEADIIHLHWVANFINYPSFFKALKNKPIVWTLHDMNPFQGIFHYKNDELSNKDILGNIDNIMFNFKYNAIKEKSNIHIVTYAKWMNKASEESKIFQNKPHYFIPNSISEKNLKIIKEKDNHYKNILFISQGIHNKRKGVDLLVEALKLIDKTRFQLTIIGDGNYSFPSNISIQHFKHTSSIEELYEYYKEADIVVIPSREDNLPNVLMESMSFGTPVLSFSVGGMKDHITTGENGILAGNISVMNLKNALEDFLLDKYHFNRYNIIEYARKNFSEQKQLESYIELYKSILK